MANYNSIIYLVLLVSIPLSNTMCHIELNYIPQWVVFSNTFFILFEPETEAACFS